MNYVHRSLSLSLLLFHIWMLSYDIWCTIIYDFISDYLMSLVVIVDKDLMLVSMTFSFNCKFFVIYIISVLHKCKIEIIFRIFIVSIMLTQLAYK